jgi:glycosyltransferase involved in cell wall biosynthesis
MSKPLPYIAVCIPTYNRSAHLLKCVTSVCKEIEAYHLQKKISVIISDNNSTDDTETVVSNLINTFSSVDIQYSKNKENIGAVNNFIQLTEFSTATFTYILGDDDNINENTLEAVLNLLHNSPAVDVLHFKCTQTNFIVKDSAPVLLHCHEAAAAFFYNIGNAGTFMFNTQKAKAIIKDKKDQLAKTCWPQTEIMFSILIQSKNEQNFLVSGIELVNSDSHNENVVYNSWYIIETFCFSLLRIAQNISKEYNDPQFLKAAKKSIPGCKEAIKYFFRNTLYVTYYDYEYEIAKTKELIKDNKKYLTGANYWYPFIYSCIIKMPKFLKKLVTAIYFFICKPTINIRQFKQNYTAIKLYQENKYAIYKAKGKLTDDVERYIY